MKKPLRLWLAYGKLTGHVAAVLGISGPGATNLVTGLYDAQLDHAPVLALTVWFIGS